MKRILILGASGTFGKALVEKLSNDEECHLTLASRHASACYHESERCHVVDCDATVSYTHLTLPTTERV